MSSIVLMALPRLILAPHPPTAVGLIYSNAADDCSCEAEDDSDDTLSGTRVN